MKTPVAAAISITAVLVAGTAAALVNSEVLQSSPTESGASAAVVPPASTIAVDVPEPTLAPTLTSPVTTETVPVTEPPVTEPAASGMLTAFEVGDAGVVTVDVIGGRLVLVSAEPAPGWSVAQESDEGENEVEVEFRSSTVKIEFEAELIDGRIVPTVESERLGGSSSGSTVGTAPAGSTPTVTIDDDDDDEYEADDDDEADEVDDDHEEYEYDDHEDEEHDDD